MTTPEAVRRRERGIIIGIAITMILVIASSVQNSHRDRAERERNALAQNAQAVAFQKCITDVVHDLTASLNARAALADPRAESIQTLINDLLAAPNDEAKGKAAVMRYQKRTEELRRKTAEHPIPPFPDGKCAQILPKPTPKAEPVPSATETS